ncbi:MAG: histidinol-phosphate aminotransferase [Pirellulaceae bacterium]|nr:MAG: histidinol-phosphate aminotransferase [Pirellulaceae bacterium]
MPDEPRYFRPQILRMSGYTPGEQPQAGKFIKLNTNENPYPPSPAVARAVQQVLEQGLARYPDPLATAFRLQAADLFGLDPDWILCGNGSDDILTIVTRALVGPGDVLRFPYPSYVLYQTLAELQGAEPEEVDFDENFDLPLRFAANRDGLRLAVVANPNSPTGTVVSRERLLELAERLPCPLLIDEAYVDFADQNCLELVQQNERILVSRSLSKSYALAGLRFGFLVAQPHLIAQFRKVKDSYNCDALSIAGATAALADQNWLAENRRKIVATRTRLTSELRRLGFHVLDSQANFVWAEHPSVPARRIYEKLREQHVLVRYMNYPRWRDGLRISVGTDPQIDVLLGLLESIVGSL